MGNPDLTATSTEVRSQRVLLVGSNPKVWLWDTLNAAEYTLFCLLSLDRSFQYAGLKAPHSKLLPG